MPVELYNQQPTMNNHLITLQPDASKLIKAPQITSSLKLIVFTMGSIHLALHIDSVHKVINRMPIHNSGFSPVGIAHVGNSEITVVDLYQRFFKSSQKYESDLSGYLVLVQNTTGELYGIPVADTPVLMEVPSSLIRILPESYRRSDTIEVASHVAVIPQETESLTVFLLDVDLLLPIFQQIKASEL